LHARDYDLLVSKRRDKFQLPSNGREISLQGGNLAIVEALPALEPRYVRLIHLSQAGDINLRLPCCLTQGSQRQMNPALGAQAST
jgi:hypothetical protein